MRAANGAVFEIRFDFIDHRLVIATNGGQVETFDLVDGLSVAEFDEKLHGALHRLGIEVTIMETPYRLTTETPFPEDGEHAAYDRDAVERFWRILDWSDGVLEEFAGWYSGKTSRAPVLARPRPRRHPLQRETSAGVQSWNTVDRETYTHEVISFGFWFGDDKVEKRRTTRHIPGARPPARTAAAPWPSRMG